jgi:hypothetical protein
VTGKGAQASGHSAIRANGGYVKDRPLRVKVIPVDLHVHSGGLAEGGGQVPPVDEHVGEVGGEHHVGR